MRGLDRGATIGLGVLLVLLLCSGTFFCQNFLLLRANILEVGQLQPLWVERVESSAFWLLLTILLGLFSLGAGMWKLNRYTQRQRQIQQELQAIATIYHQAILDAPIPIMLHAEDGEVLQVSRAWTELTGYAKSDIPTVAAWVEQAYGLPRKEAVQANIAHLYQLQQRVDEGEFAITTRHGITRIWSFYSAPLNTRSNNRQVVNSTAVDITNFSPSEAVTHCLREEVERRVAERTVQLEQANAALESFSYAIAHDLYAPLGTIQRFAQILLEDYADRFAGTERHYLCRIHDAAQRTEFFVRDLLAYSRLDRPDVRMQLVSFKSVVTQVLADLQETLQQRQAQVEIGEPLAIAHANPILLTQAITNLLTNAMKFTVPGTVPHIHLWTEDIPERGKVRLYVQDNGIGIAAKDQERIFSVFERVYPAELYPGNGIGLALVNKAMERMNGTVGVESQPGQGSRFWLELPRMTQ